MTQAEAIEFHSQANRLFPNPYFVALLIEPDWRRRTGMRARGACPLLMPSSRPASNDPIFPDPDTIPPKPTPAKLGLAK